MAGRRVLAVIAGLAVAIAAGALVRAALPATAAGASYVRPPPPPPVGVFLRGGAPKHDARIEEALAGELPRLVFAGAQLAGRGALPDAERHARVAALRTHAGFGDHGVALAGAWAALLDSLDRWLVLTTADDAWEHACRDLRARADALTDQLAAAELGYYLEPSLALDHPRRRAGIFTYRIDNVAFVRAGDRPVRVLDARRLDRLDPGVALLGITAEELDDPVVLLDTVEAKVQAQVLPVLAGHPFPVTDDAWMFSARGRAAARAAGAAIRRELLAALYTDADSAERAAIRCRQLVVASVRHHEAQHRLDQDRGLVHPAVLGTRLGDRPDSPFGLRMRFELSAYLSQLASDVWLPQLTLWNLVRHGLRRGAGRREEALVAVFVVEGLARKLGIPAAGDVLRNGEIDRDRLGDLATALAERTTVEVRSAAAALWREHYGAPLVRLTD